MKINYKKNDNSLLFNQKNKSLLDISKIQNYIPLFNNFFNLTNTNYANFNINYPYYLNDLLSKESYNKYKALLISNDTEEKIEKNIFFKYSPLLDPVKYICNKYDLSKNLITLPQVDISNNLTHSKINDVNNSAYVDGFFTFLTSQLLHTHNFIHGLDCYGTFLAIKKNLLIDISDDIDFLYNSDDFHKNNNNIFKFTNNLHIDKLNFDTRNNKKKLIINEELTNNNIISLSNINDLKEINNVFISNTISDNNDLSNNNLIFESNLSHKSRNTNSSGSTCSSRSSNTHNSDDKNSDDIDDSDNSDKSSECSESSCSTASEDEVIISIDNFPVELIALECCKDTLDSYITNNKIKDQEWDSIILQIIMMLATYQKTFNMTHNDLHTNNIMYIESEKKYIIYKINNKHYKVPTFGKIYKIIDFGRAVYSYKGTQMCSDSYSKDGDAATQYNFGVYLDEDKPVIEPNYSFDLCRLGCSIFDFFIEDLDQVKEIKSPIKKIILNWCYDDKNRNILYKNNGEERYPDFKLYKMIARTVHNHTPLKVLENEHFNQYLVSKKSINKKGSIFNIDELPVYS
jgi:hypothetical protein